MIKEVEYKVSHKKEIKRDEMGSNGLKIGLNLCYRTNETKKPWLMKMKEEQSLLSRIAYTTLPPSPLKLSLLSAWLLASADPVFLRIPMAM